MTATVKQRGRRFRRAFNAKCDADYFAALATDYRKAVCRVAEAASRVISDWDGVHRLSLELSNWYQTIGNERRLK